MQIFEEGRVKAWTDGVVFEDAAKEQTVAASKLPFVHGWIAVMPDVHNGIGSTVGTVIPTIGAIVPAAVGVDLGCGMLAAKTSLTAADLPESLAAMRAAIEKAVPHGRTQNGGLGDRGAWNDTPRDVNHTWGGQLAPGYARILAKHPKIQHRRAEHQLGTLGGGNHFIEVCLDEHQKVWVMLHSGSRGAGNVIGTYFIEKARREMERLDIHLPDRDLAYLSEGSEHFDDYIEGVRWAQEYAATSRELMLRSTFVAMEAALGRAFVINTQAINCHHNYVATEHHFGKDVYVTRKGAVSARRGELGIIPGSMGARSFIVRGKGNPESFTSCSHGAGRVMSRTQEKATAGVECRKDADVVDETPGAYKSIDAVMAAQSDLVEVVTTLKQVLCVKG